MSNTNTRERHLEIYNASIEVLDKWGGVKEIDDLPTQERLTAVRKMTKEVMDLANCHGDSAKRNLAKAMRRARFGIMREREQGNWGGKRPGSGRPPKSHK